MPIVRSTRIVLPDGVRAASIHIADGIIARVGAYGDDGRNGTASGERHSELIDVGALVVSPGIVDTHVHVNEPGRTEWEGFDTATRAAAAGGVTTIVDMPLNSIPATTTVDALDAKRAAAHGRCHVDVAFWGGVVPGNESELEGLVDAGVRGFKCFLVPSGVDEFPAVDEHHLRSAMPAIARRNVPLLVHAESPVVIADCGSRIADSRHGGLPNPQSAIRNPRSYLSYLSTRPPEAEVQAIRLIVRLALEYGARVHIVHVASADAVHEVEQAKAAGAAITAETCPHYLTFAAEEIPDGATEFKCAPPIRESRHRDALWHGLRRGVLDLIATDHSPAPPSLKCPGDFMRAWGGIASLQLTLPAVRSGVAQRSATCHQIARWMSEAPATLAGLGDRKGRIAPGYDADLCVWDPDAEQTVDASWLQHRHKLTPYAARRLRGRVMTTFLRGERVWNAGQLVQADSGHLL